MNSEDFVENEQFLDRVCELLKDSKETQMSSAFLLAFEIAIEEVSRKKDKSKKEMR